MKIMEYKIKTARIDSTEKGKKFNSFLLMNIGLLFVGPLLSVISEMTVEHESFTWLLFGKMVCILDNGYPAFHRRHQPEFESGFYSQDF